MLKYLLNYAKRFVAKTISPPPISSSSTLLADYFINTIELSTMIILLLFNFLFWYHLLTFPMENEDMTRFPPISPTPNTHTTHTHIHPSLHPIPPMWLYNNFGWINTQLLIL